MLRGKKLIKYLAEYCRCYDANHVISERDSKIDADKIRPDLLERLQDERHNLEYAARARCCAGKVSE